MLSSLTGGAENEESQQCCHQLAAPLPQLAGSPNKAQQSDPSMVQVILSLLEDFCRFWRIRNVMFF